MKTQKLFTNLILNPKIEKLSDKTFRGLIMIIACICKSGGAKDNASCRLFKTEKQIAKETRMTEEETKNTIKNLLKEKLIYINPLTLNIKGIGKPPEWSLEEVKKRSKCRCEICGYDFKRNKKIYAVVHHVIRKIDGGDNHPDNLKYVCSKCHCKLHSKYILQKEINKRT